MYLEQDWSFKINYLDVNLISTVKDFKGCRARDFLHETKMTKMMTAFSLRTAICCFVINLLILRI